MLLLLLPLCGSDVVESLIGVDDDTGLHHLVCQVQLHVRCQAQIVPVALRIDVARVHVQVHVVQLTLQNGEERKKEKKNSKQTRGREESALNAQRSLTAAS